MYLQTERIPIRFFIEGDSILISSGERIFEKVVRVTRNEESFFVRTENRRLAFHKNEKWERLVEMDEGEAISYYDLKLENEALKKEKDHWEFLFEKIQKFVKVFENEK